MELKILKDILWSEFAEFAGTLELEKVTDRNIDDKVMEFFRHSIEKEGIKINFSEPINDIYRFEGGRTPYDLLIFGKIDEKDFKIFLNNKLGDLESGARNDVTTYNNLLRLYLGVRSQRLSGEIQIDRNLLLKRAVGDEIISYAMFILDKNTGNFNFFFLEEVADAFYVNPRNYMFQVKYRPALREKPLNYCEFILNLIEATIRALRASIEKAEEEIGILKHLKEEIEGLGDTERGN